MTKSELALRAEWGVVKAEEEGFLNTRDALANQIAENRGLEQTKKVIILAIVEAAKILGLDIDENRAAQIQAEFNITSATDAEDVANEIFNKLTNGTVSR